MSTVIPMRLPLAVHHFIVAPGHKDAFDDIAVAMETDPGQTDWSPLVASTGAGWAVTHEGQRWLDDTGNRGLARRQAEADGRVVTCPDWCNSEHPRRQLALGHVTHTAHEVSGPFGYCGIYGGDLEGTVSAEIDLNMEAPRDWSPADLREAAAAFLAIADEWDKITADRHEGATKV